jgi:hypothetical protein
MWLAIWGVLVIGAALVLVPLGLSVLRRFREFQHEAGIASERFAQLNDQLEQLQAATAQSAQPGQPAVFDDLARLRRERDKAVKRAKALTAMRIRARKGQRPALPGRTAV